MTDRDRSVLTETDCRYFWEHLCVRPDFNMKPCCRFDMSSYKEIPLAPEIDKVLNHPTLQECRANAIAGKKNIGCKKCYSQEAQGTNSLRQHVNDGWSPKLRESFSVLPEDVKSVELFVGDTCNLKCVSCRPQLSSRWREDYHKLNWSLEARRPAEGVIHFVSQFRNLNHIKLVGGEPFLMKDHKLLLKTLSAQSPNDLTLEYFTNCTVIPSSDEFKLWKTFKAIRLYLSIDAVGETNDYMRYPSKWRQVNQTCNELLEICQTLDNVTVDVAVTVSVLNVRELNSLEDWFLEKKQEYPLSPLRDLIFNPLMDPDFLSLANLSCKERESVLAQLNTSSAKQGKIIQWVKNQPFLEKRNELKNYLGALESVRGNKLPQLAT